MTELAELVVGDVYERSDWGAPATPGGSRRDRQDVVGFTQHHTTGATLGVEDTVRWVFNIHEYHTNNNGWDDIGYAYLVDRFGNLFVGRGRYRSLAHARGYNSNWLGVAYLGSGIEGHVTDEGKITLHNLRKWLRGSGGMSNMNRTAGHRDLGSTSCPGSYLYRWAVELDMSLPKEVKMGTFSDVPEDHPHFEAIESLAEQGVIAGYQDGTFKPEEPITRAQVASLINRARNS